MEGDGDGAARVDTELNTGVSTVAVANSVSSPAGSDMARNIEVKAPEATAALALLLSKENASVEFIVFAKEAIETCTFIFAKITSCAANLNLDPDTNPSFLRVEMLGLSASVAFCHCMHVNARPKTTEVQFKTTFWAAGCCRSRKVTPCRGSEAENIKTAELCSVGGEVDCACNGGAASGVLVGTLLGAATGALVGFSVVIQKH